MARSVRIAQPVAERLHALLTDALACIPPELAAQHQAPDLLDELDHQIRATRRRARLDSERRAARAPVPRPA